MGIVYLASLVVGLGILLLQVIMGGKDAADGDGADDAAGKDVGKEVGAGEAGFVALFLSTRFWIFAALAFGLSGSLIHAFALAGPAATATIAAAAGLASGLFAALAYRALKRAATTTSTAAGDATGQLGRVLVACQKGKVGQIRVELKGHSVDLLATTDEDEIARGQSVLVEEVRGSVAHVSRRPPELE